MLRAWLCRTDTKAQDNGRLLRRHRSTPLIQTSQLSYSYPASSALHFPDVDVAQGSVVLLSGPSGCGKSTWLALVAGLVKPGAGSLTVADQSLATLTGMAADAWRARNIGFLPQKLHLSAALTVAQNLAMAQWAAGQNEDPQRIAATLVSLASRPKGLPDDLFLGVRFKMTCCAADAMPIEILVRWKNAPAIEDDSWVKVLGVARRESLNGHPAVVLTADEVAIQKDPPEQPYIQ